MGKTVQNYLLQQPLGEGTFAKVFKAKNLITGEYFAVKVIPTEKLKDTPKLEQCTVNQINILSQLRNQSEHIINYIDMLKTNNNFYFIYEYCNGGTLDKLIQKQGFFSQQRALKYLRQILEAFKVLNRHNIMHRDLKPENILLHNGNIKIADFSFCKLMENKDELTNTMLGSPIYMAPEVLKGQIYTMKADIWSMGIVLYRMLFGKCPYQSKSIALLIKQLEKTELQIPNQPKISSTTLQFLRRVIVKDYNQRLSWDEIFETYHITQQGQLINKKDIVVQQQQIQLRSSIRNVGNVNQNGVYNLNGMNSMRVSLPANNFNPVGLPPPINGFNGNAIVLTSPKAGYALQPVLNTIGNQFNRTFQVNNFSQQVQSPGVDKTFTAKKSPYKFQDQRYVNDNQMQNSTKNVQIVQVNQQGSIVQNRVNSFEPNYYQSQQNLVTYEPNRLNQANSLNEQHLQNHNNQKADSSQKNERAGQLTRAQIFAKHHLRCTQINQMILQICQLEQQLSSYVSYFLFKSGCKEIQSLHDNLKKQSMNDPTLREFRTIVENQMGSIGKINSNFYEAIAQQEKQLRLLNDEKVKSTKNLEEQLLQNKQKILKIYIQKLNDTDENIRLASQVIDYLEQNVLIKRDAYERMSKEHLYKQMKNKVSKE